MNGKIIVEICIEREFNKLSCDGCIYKGAKCDNMKKKLETDRPSHIEKRKRHGGLKMGLKNFNKTGNYEKIEWNKKTDGFKFKKCSEMELEKPFTVHGIIITKDRGYGNGCAAILDDCFLNLPSGMLDECKEILKDEEAVAELKSGNAKLQIRSFTSKTYHKTGYAVDFL